MIGRLALLAVIPVWLWAAIALTGGLVGVVAVVALIGGGITSSIASDLHYQCDSAVGPDPSQSVTPMTTAARRASAAVTTRPATTTTNPFADLTVAPEDTNVSDWQRACVSALKTAPYQAQPLLEPNSGVAVECARDLASARVDASSASAAGHPAMGGAGELTRWVVYRASLAASTGHCVPTDDAVTPHAAAEPSPPDAFDARPDATARACGGPERNGVPVVLPETLRNQAACGQRVDPSAMSPGDLVFWDFRDNAPTRAGVAVGAAEVVTVDQVTGGCAAIALPDRSDLRVKRVLGSGR